MRGFVPHRSRQLQTVEDKQEEARRFHSLWARTLRQTTLNGDAAKKNKKNNILHVVLM